MPDSVTQALPPKNRSRKRLAAAVIFSVVVHSLPIAGALRFPFFSRTEEPIRTRTVEVGFERIQAARAPQQAPPTPPTPPTPTPVASVNPPANPPPERPRHQPRHARIEVPDVVPDLRLRPPSLTPVRPPRIVSPQALSLRPSVPSFANTVGPLAPMIPQGALITLAVRTDRVRVTPHARMVRRLFAGIRDWREMLGGTTLNVVDDLDQLVLAAANPFGATGEAPDWFVLAKPAPGSERVLSRAIQAMLLADHPQPARQRPSRDRLHHGDGGTQSDAELTTPLESESRDGGAAPRANPADEDAGAVEDGSDHVDPAEQLSTLWTEQNGARYVQLNRYGAVRDYVLFPDGTAAIAMPSQLDALLTAMAQRAETQPDAESAVLLLGQAEGVRNVIVEVPTMHGPFPLPSRAELTISSVVGVDGALDLSAKMQYDDVAQARAAREEWVYCRTRWHAMIQNIPGLGAVSALGGMFGLRTWMSDVPVAEGMLDLLEFRVQRSSVTIHARVSPEQVRAILNVAVNVQGLARQSPGG